VSRRLHSEGNTGEGGEAVGQHVRAVRITPLRPLFFSLPMAASGVRVGRAARTRAVTLHHTLEMHTQAFDGGHAFHRLKIHWRAVVTNAKTQLRVDRRPLEESRHRVAHGYIH
jgi:hypothetical protein